MEERVEHLLKKYKNYISTRHIYFNYLNEYDSFTSSLLNHTQRILDSFETTFSFERSGNSREGALTQKKIKSPLGEERVIFKMIKIRSDISFINQIHVYFHELTHLVNNHNNQEKNEIKLSTPQKEYVAETVAQALLHSFVGGMKAKDLPPNNKWIQDEYIYRWIKNAKFSTKKINEMWRQINDSYIFIANEILIRSNYIV